MKDTGEDQAMTTGVNVTGSNRLPFGVLLARVRDLLADLRRQADRLEQIAARLGVGEADIALACVVQLEAARQAIDVAQLARGAARLCVEHPQLFPDSEAP
jgi:hypothetical protein